jgi:hypothetical protein
MKNAPFMIVCDTHCRQLFKFVAKKESMTPHLYKTSLVETYVLNFTELLDDEFLPFPFKLNDKNEFCIDNKRLESNSYHNSLLLPILNTIASSGSLQDMTLLQNRLRSYNIAQELLTYRLQYNTFLDNYAADIMVEVIKENGETTEMPLKSFPFFYKWILLFTLVSTYKEKTMEKSNEKIAGLSYPPNIICSLKRGAFLIINKSKYSPLFLNTELNRETFTTPVILAATKETDNLQQEAIFKSPMFTLLSTPPICYN